MKIYKKNPVFMFKKMKTVKVYPTKQDEDSISQDESQEWIFKVPTFNIAFCFHALYIILKFKKNKLIF